MRIHLTAIRAIYRETMPTASYYRWLDRRFGGDSDDQAIVGSYAVPFRIAIDPWGGKYGFTSRYY